MDACFKSCACGHEAPRLAVGWVQCVSRGITKMGARMELWAQMLVCDCAAGKFRLCSIGG